MNTPEPETDPISQLIEHFEDNILLSGINRVDVRYYQSEYRKKLVSNGPFIIKRIAEHLEAVKDRKDYMYNNSEEDLRRVWYLLLAEINEAHFKAIDPVHTGDLAQLSEWAKRLAA